MSVKTTQPGPPKSVTTNHSTIANKILQVCLLWSCLSCSCSLNISWHWIRKFWLAAKYVFFSAGWGTKEAENVFLTHDWEPGFECMGGLRSRETFVFTLQLLSAIAWHPPPAHPWVLFRQLSCCFHWGPCYFNRLTYGSDVLELLFY